MVARGIMVEQTLLLVLEFTLDTETQGTSYYVIPPSLYALLNHRQRNVSEPLKGRFQTNNRAELTAVLRALQIIPESRDATIISDSKYTIDCVQIWAKQWMKNGWRNSNNQDVDNKILIGKILNHISARETKNVKTDFKWVKGHAMNQGNIEADRLATQAAQAAEKARKQAREQSLEWRPEKNPQYHHRVDESYEVPKNNFRVVIYV